MVVTARSYESLAASLSDSYLRAVATIGAATRRASNARSFA